MVGARGLGRPPSPFPTIRRPNTPPPPACRAGWLFQHFMADRSAVAAAAGKPIILEEYGSPFGYVPDRDAYLSAFSASAWASGFKGALVWQVFGWPTKPSTGAGFDFDYDKAGGAAVLASYAAAAAATARAAAVAAA